MIKKDKTAHFCLTLRLNLNAIQLGPKEVNLIEFDFHTNYVINNSVP